MGKHHEMVKVIKDWFFVPENYSIVDFAISYDLSHKDLMKMVDEDEEFAHAYDYALTVMEFKVTDLMLRGSMKESVGLRLLEKYCGWKGTDLVKDVPMSPELAERLAVAVEKLVSVDTPSLTVEKGFGEVTVGESGVSVVDDD